MMSAVVGVKKMKVPRSVVLLGGLVPAVFGIFGLIGLSDSLSALATRNPEPSFSFMLSQLAPHLMLLLCLPAAIALILNWQRKRKQQ